VKPAVLRICRLDGAVMSLDADVLRSEGALVVDLRVQIELGEGARE